mmetsp:Transcript_739/g.1517  ORF Transcript_739/g.1517 Transcript_739/m.1517 type:complete len:700 (-) Transcript_739:18-2117(-)|eukprot:CAMPEP_0171372286 /NCGR_PEP_ID=MMETSP0879-20121228/9167_1 /TAXON_ID=67004 /ORGANISM="Thalassiosira weissflogii, Strain CCMP1336" /LENGTH=699 /DNA_ID=CAMNT_0011880989 /DNA_START=119 /DNA_END=2218 /DNA_ORIENTATION=-
MTSTLLFAFQSVRRSSSVFSTTQKRRLSLSCIRLLPEVEQALSSGKPVVALESTIVAHGMPYPQNLELAKDVSRILRDKGVIPATMAVKNGVFRAGLHPDELENLSLAGEENRAVKCSSRDLPLIASKYDHLREKISQEENVHWGATTVAATMRLAHAAGISTFVTGGTGGVHRGGELSLDISTDLIELSRTPVVVVSAGVKSILDIKKTLEVLETFGVPTGVWQSTEFPAFFSPVSGAIAPATFDNAMDVARAYLAGQELGMENGMLVAVPNHDPAGASVEIAIQQALEEAAASGIEGRNVTPFILKTVAMKTEGDSLRSNMSLVKQNAKVGAEIASAIAELKRSGGSKPTIHQSQSRIAKRTPPFKPRVVCVGGAVVDVVAKSSSETPMIIGTSNPGVVHRSDGGVGRNVAEVLGRLGKQPLFFTAIGGNDDEGFGVIKRLVTECGVMTTTNSVHAAQEMNTAQYFALLDHKSDLVGGIADMNVLSEIPVPSPEDLTGVDFLVLDANVPLNRIIDTVRNARSVGVKEIFFEPTSVPKARAICQNEEFLRCLSVAFPNDDELIAMANASCNGVDGITEGLDVDLNEDFRSVKIPAISLLLKMREKSAHLVITMGSRGVLLATKSGSGIRFKHFAATHISVVNSCNGAGDTLAGAFISSLLDGCDVETAVRFGMDAAILSLKCAERAISPDVSSLILKN